MYARRRRHRIPSEYGSHVVNSTAQININKTAFYLSRKSGIRGTIFMTLEVCVCVHFMGQVRRVAANVQVPTVHCARLCCRNLNIFNAFARTHTHTGDQLIRMIFLVALLA